ncbi:hypothetical protein DPMN_155946 [Dreissena polymorpha]|uniref:Uncharacterized protein n=1 Tax=Dreissena polymorpha TaxID=45954 RepID=A0A9D4FS76_DREPO|nr:hypothetical protein DPMN_155946 [Dreissena polymorpha]
MNDAKTFSRSLLSLTQLNELKIEVDIDSPSLWEALYGLNIKRLSLSASFGVFSVNSKELFCRSLLSLTQLESLSVSVSEESPDLCEALLGLNIKTLSLCGGWDCFWVNDAKTLSRSLSSLTQLNELKIEVEIDSPSLWQALCGLNIKRLSLSGMRKGIRVNYKELLCRSLLSLTQLETLSINVSAESPCIFVALHGLNIKSLILSGLEGGSGVNREESMSESLSSLKQLEKLSIRVSKDSPGLWRALRGLNFRSLSYVVG